MINISGNKNAQSGDFLVNCCYKRKKSSDHLSIKSGGHYKSFYRSELNARKNLHIQQQSNNRPIAKFKNTLMNYLHANQLHSKIATQQTQKKGFASSCEWLNMKKDQSNLVENEIICSMKRKSFHKKKNIKQYISEISLEKRKKSGLRNSFNTVQSDRSDQCQNNNKSILVIRNIKKKIDQKSFYLENMEEKYFNVSKLIPIHHAKAYFFQKQQIKSINNQLINARQENKLTENKNNFLLIQQEKRSNEGNSEFQDNQNHIRCQQYTKVDQRKQIFERSMPYKNKNEFFKIKIKENQSKKIIQLKKNQQPSKDKQEIYDIGPWKRRNTVDSQINS